MITPNDIETKVFSSSLRGYNKREVDEFLDQIMIDYQALLDQNAKMLERVHVLQKQVAEAKDPAKMTQDAKRLMNDISASAEQKAEVIIKNAKHDAENIVRNAKDSTSQADEDAERLRRKVEKFKLRFKQLLEEEIDRLDDNSEDLLDDLRKDFYPTSLYGDKAGDMTMVAGSAADAEDPIADLPDVEPTGGVEEEPSEDQSPDAEDEEASEEVFDEIESLEAEDAADETAEDTADEEADEASDEETAADEARPEEAVKAVEEEFREPDEENEESALDEEYESVVKAVKADEAALQEADNNEESEGGSAPSETIVIDKAALAEAFRKQEEDASITEADLEDFIDYDDPDRTEPEPEPAPLTEEEQVAKYAADYAGSADDAEDDPLLARAKEANVDVNNLPGFRSSINSNMDDTIVMKKIRNDETVDISDMLKDK